MKTKHPILFIVLVALSIITNACAINELEPYQDSTFSKTTQQQLALYKQYRAILNQHLMGHCQKSKSEFYQDLNKMARIVRQINKKNTPLGENEIALCLQLDALSYTALPSPCSSFYPHCEHKEEINNWKLKNPIIIRQSFSNYAQTDFLKKRLRKQNIICWITAFKGDKRIEIKEALKLQGVL